MPLPVRHVKVPEVVVLARVAPVIVVDNDVDLDGAGVHAHLFVPVPVRVVEQAGLAAIRVSHDIPRDTQPDRARACVVLHVNEAAIAGSSVVVFARENRNVGGTTGDSYVGFLEELVRVGIWIRVSHD